MSSVPHPPAADLPTHPYTPAVGTVGPVIAGRYRLLQQLGEGGFGVVYMAEQRDPVQRTVAVKVIKPGMDSAQILARFEQERQALALMDYPHIAKVLDGGTTDEGRPFFVMELVRGLPITRFCDEQRLTPRQRLDLFILVCQAIQHAHQKGIIHRDLKPSNVLVTMQDGKPVPKVIDFGVAKAVHQRLTERTMFTEIGALIGTPEYMSPEQAGVNPLDIDTRSDIYSLGVLLYELLTGVTPLDRKQLRQAAYDQVLRLIRESEPARPSTRITTIEELPSVAAQRQVEPKKLRHLLRGDLDWVVMKALEKNRNRRYETANALALDIQRYLNDEPVLAGPPSAGYRMRKFMKRNKGPVIAAGLVIVALLVGVVGMTIGFIQAKHERDEKEKARARAEEGFRQARAAVDRYFTAISENKLLNVPGLQPLRKELLNAARTYYEDFLTGRAGDPSVRAELAATHYRLGTLAALIERAVDSEAAFRSAAAIYQELVREQPGEVKYRTDLAMCHNDLGLALGGRWAEALREHQAALAIRERLCQEHAANGRMQNELAKSHNNIGIALRELGRAGEALDSFDRARLINERVLATGVERLEMETDLGKRFNTRAAVRQDLSLNHYNAAAALTALGRSNEAAHRANDGLAIQRELSAASPGDPDVASRLALLEEYLAYLHSQAGRNREALTAYERGRSIREKLLADNPKVGGYKSNLADTLHRIARLQKTLGNEEAGLRSADAARVLIESAAAAEPDNLFLRSEVAMAYLALGDLLAEAGRAAEAKGWLVQARETQTQVAARLAEVPRHRNRLGAICLGLARLSPEVMPPDEALRLVRQAEAAFESIQAPPPWTLANLACARARHVTLIGAGKMVLAAKEQAECDRLADQAMEALRQAVERGYTDFAEIRKDKDLEPLRQREDFRKLLAELEAKAGAGAK